VLCDPLLATAPLQAPAAEHELAFVDVQLRVAVSPAAMVSGVAVSVTVGVAGVLTSIFTEAGGLVPPFPEHTSVNVVSALSGPVLWLPLGANVPLHPPEATQEVASIDDQASVAAPLMGTVVLEALRLAVVSAVTAAVSPHAERIPAAARAQTQGTDCILIQVSLIVGDCGRIVVHVRGHAPQILRPGAGCAGGFALPHELCCIALPRFVRLATS
jgi:hypothetical protein